MSGSVWWCVSCNTTLISCAAAGEKLKEWPLTHLRRWAASSGSFTLDFGDYEVRKRYICVWFALCVSVFALCVGLFALCVSLFALRVSMFAFVRV